MGNQDRKADVGRPIISFLLKSKRNGLAAKVQVRNKFRKDLNVLFPAKMGID